MNSKLESTKLFKIIYENAALQSTPETRKNYLDSCAKHGGKPEYVSNAIKKLFPSDFNFEI